MSASQHWDLKGHGWVLSCLEWLELFLPGPVLFSEEIVEAGGPQRCRRQQKLSLALPAPGVDERHGGRCREGGHVQEGGVTAHFLP